MVVNNNLPVSVTIASNASEQYDLCRYFSVTFTATPVNGGSSLTRFTSGM